MIAGSIFLIYVSKNHIKNIILASITFGLIFSVTTEYYHALDEKKHFISAYNLAYFNFDYVKNPIQSDDSEGIPHRINYNEFYTLYAKKYEGNIRPNTNEDDTSSTPTTYSKVLYIGSAIGIFVAKTIGGSIADVFVTGRVFNLALYTLLVCIAIKILPFKKNIFVVIALLPMTMLLAASYSIDGICIGLLYIFIAYVLKLFTKEIIKPKEWGILLILYITTFFAKSMAYIAIACIILILPLWKIIKGHSRKVKISLLISAIIACIISVCLFVHIKDNMLTTDTRGGNEVDSKAQIEYLMNNPFNLISLEANYTINSLLNFNWLQCFHQSTFFTGNYGPVTFLIIMFIVFYISLTDDSYNFNKKDKAILIVTFAIIFVMTNIVLYISYTPVKSDSVVGYQARYLIPILPLLLICLSNKRVSIIKNDNDYSSMFLYITSEILLIIGLIEEILVSKI